MIDQILSIAHQYRWTIFISIGLGTLFPPMSR
jgi:hypothetical protein